MGGEQSAGALGEVTAFEFGLVQPATSRHLRVLRESGLVCVRVDGPRRLYSLEPAALQEIDEWLGQFRHLWSAALSALDTEVHRGQRERTQGGKA